MKRKNRLIAIGCTTLGGTFVATTFLVGAATGAASAATPATPATPPPAASVTVQPGDSLSAIGVKTSRTWPQLAGYNHIADPDLIYAGEVVRIPPTSYVPSSATASPSRDSVSSSTVSSSSESTGAPSGVFGCIADHESGGDPSTDTGNGFYGMYQDTQSSWVEGGGLAYAPQANEATAAEQTIVNERIQADQGWGAWPVSSGACGV